MKITSQISDERLYELCQQYGEQARIWRQRFAGLLPEVERRRLYIKKGFSSIFEFAKKLAGMSEEQVRRVLNISEKFEDKPVLKNLLESGEVSVNKLARVASIATKENESYLAEQVKMLPQSAIETLIRDERLTRKESLQNINHTNNSVRAHRSSDNEVLNLSTEVKTKLLELQQKGIDINAMLLEFLKKREEEIAHEKKIISDKNIKITSQYIPVETKRLLQKEHGTKCSIQGCMKNSEEIHHTQRFSLGRNHDPHFLAPLCKDHHIIAHSIDNAFHRMRSG